MPVPCLHVLPWDRPLARTAAIWLTGDWKGETPLDLAHWLVVVPTQQAGRRLRAALATQAAAYGQAVFPPQVVLPETLATLGAPADGQATRLEAQLAWMRVLRDLSFDEFSAVFPVEPPTRNFAWASRLATQLLRLQATLAEGGWRMADVPGVAAKAEGDFPEAERWRELALLEKRYDACLAVHGRRDPQAAKRAFAMDPILPAGITRLATIGVPDPLPLAIAILERHVERIPVDILVCGPTDEAAESLFDGWGRPLPEVWNDREVAPADFDERVHLCVDPAEQGARLAALARGYGAVDGKLAIGVADPEVLPPLTRALARAGVPAFNPEGQSRRQDRLYALLTSLAALAEEPSFEAAAILVRCPDVLAWLGTKANEGFLPAGLLAEMDELQARHLPSTIAAARVHATAFSLVGPVLAELESLHCRLVSDTFPENAAMILAEIFSKRRVEADEPLAESAGVWMEALREAGEALAVFGGDAFGPAERWQLALERFAENRRTEEKSMGALELLGWLELLWEDAPHLAVAGFNDGSVPEAVSGDVFLPEALRVRLGLKTNAARLARDAYLLAALGAFRTAGKGRLDLLLGKTSLAGEPRRPSRLLLRCPDEVLPGRVERLFRAVETAQPSPPWARAWRLRPRWAPPPTRVSVTALRDYLSCPFRFYLRHVLKMSRVDLAKAELDARDFGTLLHAALQQLGGHAALRDCADEAILGDFLLERFETEARARYGTELTLPLVVQFESARQRLRAAAAVEARERAEGWRTERVEWAFAFPLEGLEVRGKIDRIDRNVDGRVRVLDYKTSDSASEPMKTHLRAARPADGDGPAWRQWVDGSGKLRVWSDLQLPLYLRAVAAEWGDVVGCGYFNLPKAAGASAVAMWDDFSRETQGEAERCARGAAMAIAAGAFWPPVELDPRDDGDWAELFHQGAAESVEAPEDSGQRPEAGGRRSEEGA